MNEIDETQIKDHIGDIIELKVVNAYDVLHIEVRDMHKVKRANVELDREQVTELRNHLNEVLGE